jgi:hypothetical protein
MVFCSNAVIRQNTKTHLEALMKEKEHLASNGKRWRKESSLCWTWSVWNQKRDQPIGQANQRPSSRNARAPGLSSNSLFVMLASMWLPRPSHGAVTLSQGGPKKAWSQSVEQHRPDEGRAAQSHLLGNGRKDDQRRRPVWRDWADQSIN